MNGKLLGLTITLAAVAFVALGSLFTVNERQLALVVQFGNLRGWFRTRHRLHSSG